MYALLLLITSGMWTWSPAPHDPHVLRLWDGNTLAGEYCTSTGVYRAWNGLSGRCDVVAEPPACLPVSANNFGVETGKLRPLITRYRLSGMPVSRDVAFEALKGRPVAAGVPDRRSQRWITAAGGSEQQRKQLLDALPADVKGSSRVQSYPAGHWALRPGFAVRQDVPTLYVQTPSGGVIHRHEGTDVTPELISALREPDPKYDPKLSPDLRKGWPGLPRVPVPVGAAGVVLAGVAAAGAGSGRKKKGE